MAAGQASTKRKARDEKQVISSDSDEEEGVISGLSGGSDDESEGQASSDEEEETRVSTKDLPKPKGTRSQQETSTKPKPGVVYLGRLPRGFEEAALTNYFSQFGVVNKLRVSRNKKTGKSKHYAFIEFAHESVAEIVAETMHNYLLTGHILQCKVLPLDKIHPKMWVGASKPMKPIPASRRPSRLQHNASKSPEKRQLIGKKLMARDEKKRQKLAEMGIEYDFAGYQPTTMKKDTNGKTKESSKNKSTTKSTTKSSTTPKRTPTSIPKTSSKSKATKTSEPKATTARKAKKAKTEKAAAK